MYSFYHRDYPKGLSKQFPYKSQPHINIVLRLQKRQTYIGTPAEEYRLQRLFHQCVVPNYTETNVNISSGYLRKFSPDGNLLIGFSTDQRSVNVYDYFGAGAGQSLYVNCDDLSSIRHNLFKQFFRLRHSIHVSSNLNCECSLFTADSRYVILGSSSPLGNAPFLHMYDILRNNEGIASSVRSPVEDYTLYMIDIQMGSITDIILYRYDNICLVHNQGLSLCGSVLAVLSVQHQTVHLYRVSDGIFNHMQDIGVFCYPDDCLIYSKAKFTSGSDSDDEDQDSLVQHSYHNRWFNSLKHRILCWCFEKAQSMCTSTNNEPVFEYYKKFDKLVSLRMWKMQLLSEDRLLLKYADKDIVSIKQTDPASQPAVFVFYDIKSTKILAVYDNTSEELLHLYENYMDEFRGPVFPSSSKGYKLRSQQPSC